MQSDGGSVHPLKLSGLRALLSGPAAGVIGYARTCYVPEKPKAVIGFDMGGTSTDVFRCAGSLKHVLDYDCWWYKFLSSTSTQWLLLVEVCRRGRRVFCKLAFRALDLIPDLLATANEAQRDYGR
jgi:hypothetical protein